MRRRLIKHELAPSAANSQAFLVWLNKQVTQQFSIIGAARPGPDLYCLTLTREYLVG